MAEQNCPIAVSRLHPEVLANGNAGGGSGAVCVAAREVVEVVLIVSVLIEVHEFS
jgi:hypothetical protein